ncbi:FkbM family methyltransferase [Tsuneonella sp. SYSU-LHT278]|uniref:FkbM family methyltransferase n=1 Tax=Tsuneonella sediminis TaxID=3416089 RepID=UPI003F79AD58
MAPTLKRTIKRLLATRGLALANHDHLDMLQRDALIGAKAQALSFVDDAHLRQALDLLAESQSQLNQDLFALDANGWKRGGFFVEFGATDGKSLSNTWLLEKAFGWTGILAEPARRWHAALAAAGRAAAIERDCVWEKSGETLEFAEAEWGELSTITSFRDHDHHDRRGARTYRVPTISLVDMLDRHNAPAHIDYLSIDTEGSEYAILSAFDFERYRFGAITVEHNFTPYREKLHALLTAHGYRRTLEDLSQFDDWYIAQG